MSCTVGLVVILLFANLLHDGLGSLFNICNYAGRKWGVVILRILYCSLGRYEMHTSVRPAAVVGGVCSALRVLV